MFSCSIFTSNLAFKFPLFARELKKDLIFGCTKPYLFALHSLKIALCYGVIRSISPQQFHQWLSKLAIGNKAIRIKINQKRGFDRPVTGRSN